MTTPAGLEPTRENPMCFLGTRLNHSATVSLFAESFASIRGMKEKLQYYIPIYH